MGNARKTNNNNIAANKRKGQSSTDKKVRVSNGNDAKKNSNTTLEAAFRRASFGRVCPLCGKRVEHAVYQRHFEDCKPADENDDIIFCGQFTPNEKTRRTSSSSVAVGCALKREQPSNSQSQLTETMVVTKKRVFGTRRIANDEVTAQHGLLTQSFMAQNGNEKEYSPQADDETGKDERSTNNNNQTIDTIADLDLVEVYKLILNRLENFLGRYRCSQIGEQVSNSQSKDKFCVTASESQSHFSNSQNQRNVHYSLRFMWKIIYEVLLCPEHRDHPSQAVSFWGESLRVILRFLTISVEAQQLFVRLLIRRWAWHTVDNISKNYPELGNDISQYFTELYERRLMQNGFSSGSISVDDALKLMRLDDVLPICKKFKIDTTLSRLAMIQALKKFSTQLNIFGMVNKTHVFKSIKSQVGECFRITPDSHELFTALMTVNAPTQMDTAQLNDTPSADLGSQLMFLMLQQQNGQLSFMSPPVLHHSLVGLYLDFPNLISYIKAKNYEQKLINLADRNALKDAFELAEKIKSTFTNQYLVEKPTYDIYHFTQLPVFLRRFTPPWVFCRCIFHGVEMAQKLRNYEVAVDWLEFLLEKEDLRYFCNKSRGLWYQRLALNLESHLKKMEKSAQVCLAGIRDPLIGPPDKLTLQNRLVKLLNRRSAAIEQLHSKDELMSIEEPEKVHIIGTTLAKGLGDGKQMNHFYIPSNGSPPSSSSSTSPAEQQNVRCDINKCTVEDIALVNFLEQQGYKEGVFSESQIWHTLFRLFFYDIIYSTANFDRSGADKVWLSLLQCDPLDLNFTDFHANRQEAIDTRLAQIAGFSADVLPSFGYTHFHRIKSHLAPNSSIGWHQFKGADQLARFLRCCSPSLLNGLFRRLCTDFRNTRSGFPDLTVWNSETRKLAVVEVKGPNDQLSTKQQLWLDFFKKHGVRAVVCHVEAKNDRAL